MKSLVRCSHGDTCELPFAPGSSLVARLFACYVTALLHPVKMYRLVRFAIEHGECDRTISSAEGDRVIETSTRTPRRLP